MPKIVNKEETIESIKKATLSAFAEYGFHKTTMDKIAKKAGIAKGTLYLYFDSKEALSQSIMVAYFKKTKDDLMTLDQFKTIDSLLKHIENTLTVTKEDMLLMPIFFEAFGPSFASKEFTEEISSFFNGIGDYYAKHLQSLMDQGVVCNTINPTALGRVLVSMFYGVLLHKGLFKQPDDQYAEMISEVINLLRRGLETAISK